MLPDDRLCGCRWSSTSVSNGEDFREALNNLIEVYQRAEWFLPETVTSMNPFPEFVAYEIHKHRKYYKQFPPQAKK